MLEPGNPLVSIALCTYNGELHLREQLDTLIKQTYRPIEIIAVDDSSSDATVTILQEYAARCSFLHVFCNDQNLGYVKNFEKALGLCNGHFIALSDQDDIWELNKIEQQVTSIGGSALIYHDSQCIDEEGKELSYRLSDIYPLYEGRKPHPFFFFNCVSGHSILFKKELLKDLFPFDVRYFHDRWIAFIATERGGIKLIKQSLVKYRQHGTSQTDLLRLRSSMAGTERFFNTNSLDWLKNCQAKSVFYQKYLEAILSCFSTKGVINANVKLYLLLSSKATSLFFPVRKSRISTLNFIRKICFLPRHS